MNVKPVLVLCLLLVGIITRPVQSQTLGACGLPTAATRFTSSTTLNMTADCTVAATGNSFGRSGFSVFMQFESGTYTINGNGHRIIGSTNASIIVVAGGATVNLNGVIIDGVNSSHYLLQVRDSATFTISNTIIRNSRFRGIRNLSPGEMNFNNVEILDNTQTYATSALLQLLNQTWPNDPNARMNLNNVILRGNSVATANRVIYNEGGTLRFSGCFTNENNVHGSTPTGIDHGGNTVNDASTGPCPTTGFSYWLALTPQPKKKSKATATPWPSPTPRPPSSYQQEYTELQEETGITITAAHGLGSGVHFRQLDGAGIGVQALIDAGPLAAIDVYGYVEQGVEICFPHVGRVIFLDAATMPRAMTALEAWQDDGATCVSIDRPGSLVLLPPE